MTAERFKSPQLLPFTLEPPASASSLFDSPPPPAPSVSSAASLFFRSSPQQQQYQPQPPQQQQQTSRPSSNASIVTSPILAPAMNVEMFKHQKDTIALLVADKASLAYQLRELEAELDRREANGAGDLNHQREVEGLRRELDETRGSRERLEEELRTRRTTSLNEVRCVVLLFELDSVE